jgi:hypothetical protein
MKFDKEILQELVYGDFDGYKVIQHKLIDNSRWSLVYEMIFQFEDKFYRTTYQQGATEQQDESPYEYEDDNIECPEVFPVEKTIIVYEAKK